MGSGRPEEGRRSGVPYLKWLSYKGNSFANRTRCPADGSHMRGYPSFSFQAATIRAKMQPKREITAGDGAYALHPTMDRGPCGLQRRPSRAAARASVRWSGNPLGAGRMRSFAACADQLAVAFGTWLCACDPGVTPSSAAAPAMSSRAAGGGVRSAPGGSAFGGALPQVVVIQGEFLCKSYSLPGGWIAHARVSFFLFSSGHHTCEDATK